MKIKIDDLTDPRITEFLEEHIEDMKSASPPESMHTLDIEALKEPEITFWSVWQEGELVGCGAIKEIEKGHGEIKSMRTRPLCRGSGIGAFILKNILSETKLRGYQRVSLETGSFPFFEPARRLYSRFGFTICEPFATYKHDPNSVFMSLILKNA